MALCTVPVSTQAYKTDRIINNFLLPWFLVCKILLPGTTHTNECFKTRVFCGTVELCAWKHFMKPILRYYQDFYDQKLKYDTFFCLDLLEGLPSFRSPFGRSFSSSKHGFSQFLLLFTSGPFGFPRSVAEPGSNWTVNPDSGTSSRIHRLLIGG